MRQRDLTTGVVFPTMCFSWGRFGRHDGGDTKGRYPLAGSGGSACIDFYLGRVCYHLVYDAFLWDISKEEGVFFVFFSRILF